MWRPVVNPFLLAVLAAVMIAASAAATTAVPSGGAPTYALDAALIYRVEVGLAVFLALYAVAVLVRLAAHGLTPGRVGTSSVELPQLMDIVGTKLRNEETTIDDMLGTLEAHSARIEAIERMTNEAR